MATRQQVFAALDGEREYQRKRNGIRDEKGKATEQPKGVGDFLVYIQHYLTGAFAAHNGVGNGALDMIRKITALGVACMEQNGVVPRGDALVQNIHDGQMAF